MKLTHKIFKLANPNGESVEIQDVNDLHLLIEDVNTQMPLGGNEDGSLPVIVHEINIDGSGFNGHSILQEFELKNGYLVHNDMHVSFFDKQTKTQLLIAEVSDMSLLLSNFEDVELNDAQVHDILNVFTTLYKKVLESIEHEVEVSNPKPVEIVENNESTDNKPEQEIKEESKPEEPTQVVVAPAEPEVPVIAEASDDNNNSNVNLNEAIPQENSTPKPEAETAINENIEDNAIPEEVNKQYEDIVRNGYVDTNGNNQPALVTELGYTEHAYKNYRFLQLPDSNGQDVYLLLLTKQGVMSVPKLIPVDNQWDEHQYTYKFKIDDQRKILHVDLNTGEIVVKRLKKKDSAKQEETTETSE